MASSSFFSYSSRCSESHFSFLKSPANCPSSFSADVSIFVPDPVGGIMILESKVGGMWAALDDSQRRPPGARRVYDPVHALPNRQATLGDYFLAFCALNFFHRAFIIAEILALAAA